jgi:hypothetical protein
VETNTSFHPNAESRASRSGKESAWKAESLDALRDYLDPVLRDVCRKTYFEVDAEAAMGIAEGASASA